MRAWALSRPAMSAGRIGLIALCVLVCGELCGFSVFFGEARRRSRAPSTLLLDNLKMREREEVWDSRMLSQYQQVHSE